MVRMSTTLRTEFSLSRSMKDSRVLVECPIVKTAGDGFPLMVLVFAIVGLRVDAKTRRRSDALP